MRSIILAIACVIVLWIVVYHGRLSRENFDGTNAALVCYWAPGLPPASVATRPDPRASLAGDAPLFSDVRIPFATTSPMVQERSTKTELVLGSLERMPQNVPVDRKAYVETTTAPPQILGVLPLAPTNPPPAPMESVMIGNDVTLAP